MSEQGYARIYRTLLGHPAFRNDGEAMAFAWMVLRASWRPVRVRYKGQSVFLDRGQLAVSVRDLAEALDRQKGWIERLLKRLKNETMIETHAETGVNVITICNYGEYQAEQDSSVTPTETPNGTRAGQAQDTEQRREEYKKEEPIGSSPPVAPPAKKSEPKRACQLSADWFPILTPRSQAVVDGWPPGKFEAELRRFKDHAADKGRTSKDWQAAFRTWIEKADDWMKQNGNGRATQPPRDQRDGLVRALDRRLDAGIATEPAIEARRPPTGAGEGDSQGGLALTAQHR